MAETLKRRESFRESESQAQVRALLGSCFFGITEARRAFVHNITPAMCEARKPVRLLARDRTTLLTEEQSWDVIRRCNEEAPGAFVCCVGFPYSVWGISQSHLGYLHPSFSDTTPWFARREERVAWSTARISDTWFLLEKEAVVGSIGIAPEQQTRWLEKKHPSRIVARPEHVVYASVLCAANTSERIRLNSTGFVRTSCTTASGHNVCVGFNECGLCISEVHDQDVARYGMSCLWTS